MVFQSRKLKPRKEYEIKKSKLSFRQKTLIAKMFVQNKEAFNIFKRIFVTHKDINSDNVEKVNLVFDFIPKHPDKSARMYLFTEMIKYSWDIAFITNYVNNSMKFRDDLVR